MPRSASTAGERERGGRQVGRERGKEGGRERERELFSESLRNLTFRAVLWNWIGPLTRLEGQMSGSVSWLMSSSLERIKQRTIADGQH